MADVAATFHWPLSEFAGMSLTELLKWRQLAVERWRTMNGIKD